jgi:hypothetical protein
MTISKTKNAIFVKLGFNLSNGVTDTLESSSILIYFGSDEKYLYVEFWQKPD